MTYEVVGTNQVNYTNRQGNKVEGFNLYLIDLDTKRESLNGNLTKDIYVSKMNDIAYQVSRKLVPQDRIQVLYNDRGYVETIVPLEG